MMTNIQIYYHNGSIHLGESRNEAYRMSVKFDTTRFGKPY